MVKNCWFQNQELGDLAREAYDLESLGRVRQALAAHGTLRLIRYPSGGASAVTPLDDLCQSAAWEGGLINMWDRDSAVQGLGELQTARDSWLGNGLGIGPESCRRGLLAKLRHAFDHRRRFLDFIEERRHGRELGARPHVRYDPWELKELPDVWGHGQNDAKGFLAFLLFHCLNEGYVNWEDPEFKPLAEPVACLLYSYFWRIQVWCDWELGAWEDKDAEHSSSILVVSAGLAEVEHFLCQRGWELSWPTGSNGNRLRVTRDGVEELLGKCHGTLREVLPHEAVRGNIRYDVDAAQVHGLFLSSLSGRRLIDDAMTVQIIDQVERMLMRHIGIVRYHGDCWDGRCHRPGMPEAQWTQFSPMISMIMGDLYRRTGREEHFDRQVFHLNRSFAQVDGRWRLPEAYIVDPGTGGHWIPNANSCLAVTQAATICALAGMKASLLYRQQCASPLRAA